jgi:Domain of unknown function (DUF4167)
MQSASRQKRPNPGISREAAPQRRWNDKVAMDLVRARQTGLRGHQATFLCECKRTGQILMNTNNRPQNNNNRRRGRNNNNNRQQNNNRSGFDYNNSIDNRARGNAAQMLEKYKKLAQDAQFNDDRVNAEYHLQFADHYFRVLADFRSRQEARAEQQGERRPREDAREDRDDWQNDDRTSSYDEQPSNEGAESEAETARESDDRRPQRDASNEDRRPRRNDRNDRGSRNNDRDGNRAPRRHHSEEMTDEPAGLDLAVLPPSIALANDESQAEEARPARKPRARRPKSANDDETVTAAE